MSLSKKKKEALGRLLAYLHSSYSEPKKSNNYEKRMGTYNA